MKFNDTKDAESPAKTVNKEGGQAFEAQSPELRLYKRVINNLLEDTYYEDDEAQLEAVRHEFEACADESPAFVGKLAAYAQQEMGLRDISTLLLVLSAQRDETREHAREYATDVFVRPDGLTTAVAMNDALTGSALPQALRDGLNAALSTFDAYQLSKYDTDRREYNLRDVLNRTHPNPADDDEQAKLYERLMLGRLDDHPDVEPLEPPETWEVIISEQGNTPEAWREALDRMGMFAKIRNVRNMLEAGLDGEEIFGDDGMEYVESQKFLPFRFYQSYLAMTEARLDDAYAEDWLSQAINATATNIPSQWEDTLVAVDTSGSMSSAVSGRSSFECKQIAAFFGAVCSRIGADVMAFASDVEAVNFHSDTPTVERAQRIERAGPGGSTNGWKVLDFAETLANAPDGGWDRVVFLTDMQLWDSTHLPLGGGRSETLRENWDAYKQQVPEACLYMIDLQSYGDLATPEGRPDVFNVSGWSPKVLEYVEYAEEPGAVIREIEAYDS